MTRRNQIAIASLVALGLGFGMAGQALAQDDVNLYEDELAEPGEDMSADDLSDKELEAFLEAAESVQDIRAEAAEDLAEADEGHGDIISEANEDMIEAIEDRGLDPETYQGIGYLFEEDEKLAERLNRAAAERQSED